MTDPTAMVPTQPAGAVDMTDTITQFENALLAQAEAMGLPSSGVLVEVYQRVQVLSNMDGAMAGLPREKRATSMYLSKFLLAVSAGLFDAALNYLWDETIGELRKRIIDYDLDYFFDNAVSADKRKELRGPDDLVKVTDDELIRAAQKVGFISPLGQQQLDLVRHMRNHASAAHPNQHELQPYSLLGYMETCIKEVITLPQSPTMVQTGRLLANVKTATVTKDEAASFATLFAGLRRDQSETLANGLFGIYVSLDSTPVIRDNVRLLLPHLWPNLSENVKFAFGTRFARFKASLDIAQAELAKEFLQSVDGSSYLPEDVRAAEIDVLLDRLHGAHLGMNNFYNEPPIAKELATYIGALPVPPGVRAKYADGIVDAFLARSSGIAFAADGLYEQMLLSMTPGEANLALLYATGADASSKYIGEIPKKQLDRLVTILTPKLVSRPAQALMANVNAFTGPRQSMAIDSKMVDLRNKLAITL